MQLAKQIQCPETKWRLQGARQLACAFHRWRSLRLKKAPNASDNWLREFRKAGLEVVVGPFALAKVQTNTFKQSRINTVSGFCVYNIVSCRAMKILST